MGTNTTNFIITFTFVLMLIERKLGQMNISVSTYKVIKTMRKIIKWYKAILLESIQQELNHYFRTHRIL